jgi:twinkle protein
MGAIETLPVKALKARGVREDVAAHYGVRVAFNPSTGEELAYCYPITEKGAVIGYKVRELPKTFYTVGESKGRAVDPFGMAQCQRTGKRLLIVGGQDDMLSAYQMLWDRYPQYKPNVISLTRGENDVQCIKDNMEFVKGYEEVILCLDNDEVGQQATKAFVKLLGNGTKVMRLSEKDPNDMLLKKKEKEFVNAFFQAQVYTPVNIVAGGIGLDALMVPTRSGVIVDSLPNTSKILHGFRDGEMTLVLAPPGVGKTTICKEIGYSLVNQGYKVLHIFLEEDLQKTQQSYIAIDNGVSVARLRANPSIISRERWADSYNRLIDNGNTLWVNHWGSINPDEVMETLRWGASYGCQFAILDHISMVFSGMESSNERKDIDLLLTQMAAFTKESSMHPIVVSHVKRKENRWKVKDFPYWDVVATDTARGSGAFEQLASNVISLEVEYLDEDMTKGRIRTRIGKNREWGLLGVGDVLQYNITTGRIQTEANNF